MIQELNEGDAMAIIEYTDKLQAKNLSGSLTDGRGIGRDGDLREAHPEPSASPAAQIQFPSEAGHWYSPKTWEQVTLPPRTWAKTYIAKGYVPGVTTITRQLHKEALRTYDVNRAILFAREELARNGFTGDDIYMIDDAMLISVVRDKMKSESEEITGRGKELHGVIEQYATRYGTFDTKWENHIGALANELVRQGIDVFTGSTEHSFATARYGGKIDWHNDQWLLDFKTKPRIEDGKKLAYPEHCWQLAAYSRGLWETRPSPPPPLPVGRRCANVFIGVEDAEVVFHEWSEKDLLKGWRKFEALLNVWWSDYQ